MTRYVGATAIGWVLAAAIGAAVPAAASEKLEFAPAASWVRPILAPAEADRDQARDIYAVLNRSLQVRFADDGDSTYWETLVQIQTPRGLGIARPTVHWDPVNATIIINKAHLIRNGQIIDLLARGQTFTVMRRETQLEKAIMDGELTAVLQPDGVEVGDIIDFAYTRVRRIAVLGGSSESLWSNIGIGMAAKRETRFTWPARKPLRWRLSDDMPVPTFVRTGDEVEMSLNLDAYKQPEVQDMAPNRFNRFGEVQLSEFTSWSQVSALIAPYYDRAARLTETSPLKAEVAKIRALSADPKVQAAAALHLVQQKIRYTYVELGEGGFVPPSADLTWLRRWGDCKAKSALLTALLRELGIAADPALVNTVDGNGLNERLPALVLFDHVIVRSVIDGKPYWLDGTLPADGGLDDLSPPSEEWALPMTAKGEELQSLVGPPLTRPQAELHVALDASNGLDGSVGIHIDVVTHGSEAVMQDQRWQTVRPDDLDMALRKYWRVVYPGAEIGAHRVYFDPASMEMHYVMDGATRLKSIALAGSDRRAYPIRNVEVADNSEVPDRTPGLHAYAPVSLTFPMFNRTTVTVRLPNGGQGYEAAGQQIDRVLAGIEMTRHFGIVDGVFTAEVSQRTLVPEISLAEVKAAADEIDALSESGVLILTPGGASGAAVVNGSPASAESDNAQMESVPLPARPLAEGSPEPVDPAGMSFVDLGNFYAGGRN
ncbi:hypothetical protein AEAC466_02050 [Asticcacaulis sp. AC466]|uniref:DUF3857 domain-containing transglutaminase family protein n=1 Tax=Asticcacaulis sp. AC466 TaxID=1282362 RepID=UPI0003C3F9B3|nr:DUF3857 domain-containing transglutaminase family protein [Asticcacaulis sp. AC466]ESQ85990.1 hypothetical protein AEAC466_02050 [Asticcacaulis sp. AC466]